LASQSSPSAIVSAWVVAEQAFEDAARSADADQPELAATTIDPQLTWTKVLLARMRQNGQAAVGVDQFGHPRVMTEQGPLATVETCAHDAEIVVSAATGMPVPGEPGQVDDDHFTSTMEWTDTGWKLADQTVEADQCRP
jgi:hypothetical protein